MRTTRHGPGDAPAVSDEGAKAHDSKCEQNIANGAGNLEQLEDEEQVTCCHKRVIQERGWACT